MEYRDLNLRNYDHFDCDILMEERGACASPSNLTGQLPLLIWMCAGRCERINRRVIHPSSDLTTRIDFPHLRSILLLMIISWPKSATRMTSVSMHKKRQATIFFTVTLYLINRWKLDWSPLIDGQTLQTFY